jgi:hypothetical protein
MKRLHGLFGSIFLEETNNDIENDDCADESALNP